MSKKLNRNCWKVATLLLLLWLLLLLSGTGPPVSGSVTIVQPPFPFTSPPVLGAEGIFFNAY